MARKVCANAAGSKAPRAANKRNRKGKVAQVISGAVSMPILILNNINVIKYIYKCPGRARGRPTWRKTSNKRWLRLQNKLATIKPRA
jgi:hypothetical protein